MRLKVKLGLGAALLGLAALVTAAILYFGMERVSLRIEASLAAERRIERYAALSTQVSTFIVVAAESVQTGLDATERAARLDGVVQTVQRTFVQLRADLQDAVAEARRLGIDEQSRRATQSIGIARMEALFASAHRGFLSDTQDPERLRGFLDIFATGFDPLLNEVVQNEVRAREAILAGIDDLRERLVAVSFVIAALTVAAFAGFYLGLVRPQFRRLDRLREAAQRMGREDFAVTLPVDRRDEIGGLYAETNRMAHALGERQRQVAAEWARLNDTIAARTEELRAANARLAQTDEDRRRFFADISHELRTPLTVILMEAQLGRAGGSDPAAAFATIEARSERLNRRIDDLLRIARSESGKLALSAEEFDLAQVARDALEETAAETANAGLTVDDRIAGPLRVTGDRNWMRQVLAGLVRNAVRHARAGGHLAVAAGLRNGRVRVDVIDNGPGIPPEAQGAVFERFRQAGTARSEGFGIGLALAHWVIEAQGGAISVTSPVAPDEALGVEPGTKVTVEMPLTAD